MNVLLIEINPFSPASIPISIGYIGAFLKTKGFNVKILNIGEDTNLSKTDLYNTILEFRPGLVGFSTYQRNILYVLAVSKFIKEIVGPHENLSLGNGTFIALKGTEGDPPGEYVTLRRHECERLLIGVDHHDSRRQSYSAGREEVQNRNLAWDDTRHPSVHFQRTS